MSNPVNPAKMTWELHQTASFLLPEVHLLGYTGLHKNGPGKGITRFIQPGSRRKIHGTFTKTWSASCSLRRSLAVVVGASSSDGIPAIETKRGGRLADVQPRSRGNAVFSPQADHSKERLQS